MSYVIIMILATIGLIFGYIIKSLVDIGKSDCPLWIKIVAIGYIVGAIVIAIVVG